MFDPLVVPAGTVMRFTPNSWPGYRTIAIAIVVLAALWLAVVPAVLSPINFVTIAGLLAALGWIASTTYRGAQSQSSIGQVIHETESSHPAGPRRATTTDARP
jgi:hypothetical protein